MNELSRQERIRYDRQMMINGFGEEGQKNLKSTTALIAGAGGLGSPVSIYLAVAGIGKLKIVDNDEVELSNLNRQILYGDEELGRNKGSVSEKNVKKFNEDIEIEGTEERITKETVWELTNNCDLIADCMDNYQARYLLNKASIEKGIPLFHAAVEGMSGQITTLVPGETPCLKCIIPNPPPPEKFPVLGATPGLLGCIQVHEIIKYIVGIGPSLKNKLLIVDGGTEFRTVEVRENPKCEVCGES